MSEQREALAEALADSWLVDQIDCAEVAQVLAPTVAALLADAEQRGADRVAAAAEAACEFTAEDIENAQEAMQEGERQWFRWLFREKIRAALTTGAADRVRAEACPSVLFLRYGSAACDLPDGHPGEHHQEASGRTWTDVAAEKAQMEDDR